MKPMDNVFVCNPSVSDDAFIVANPISLILRDFFLKKSQAVDLLCIFRYEQADFFFKDLIEDFIRNFD